MSPIGILSKSGIQPPARKAPLRFADRTTLPRGIYVAMPSVPVTRDPEIFTNPEEFNGVRFFDKTSSAMSAAGRDQFATIGPENLAFGFSKTACPGRFFVGAQIKAVLANLTLNYEVSFPGGQATRPENL
ncbi:hypothetical protein BBP40_009801 [Aspergillus hancockii]|nr:hypothetical protein BBP40_009801 [Aspergillus hancockii]